MDERQDVLLVRFPRLMTLLMARMPFPQVDAVEPDLFLCRKGDVMLLHRNTQDYPEAPID